MQKVQRRITFRLYPTTTQQASMEEVLGLHCRVYNTLLEEHKRRHEAGEPAYSFAAMCRDLTLWRKQFNTLGALSAQSLQVTAKRASLAFAAFFQRVAAGEAPGYPRFKAPQRFSGWGYKTYGDGWKLIQEDGRHGQVRLSGIGLIRMRGRGRFVGAPKTAEVITRGGKWYLSVTYDVAPEQIARQSGSEAAAFDWGLGTLLTIARSDGRIENIGNPRWLKVRLTQIKVLQRALDLELNKLRLRLGIGATAPVPGNCWTNKMKRLAAQIRAIHGKVARQRLDFYHKLTANLVSRFGAIGTEQLAVANMARRPKPRQDESGVPEPNGAARKAGLNRGILDAAPSMLIGMLRTKAEEAGTWFAEANTRSVKPTQRCHACGSIAKKDLSERVHQCACGACLDRDENAARVLLRWMKEGDFWSGTGQVKQFAA